MVADHRGPDALTRSQPLLRSIPDPLTGVAWGDVARVHPDLAEALGLSTGVRLEVDGEVLELPVVVTEGIHPTAVGVPPEAWHLFGGELKVTAAEVQPTLREPPDPRWGPTVAAGDLSPVTAGREPGVQVQIEGDGGHRWGLVVDVDRCVGCSACVAACAVENNVFPRGADRGDPSWIRIEAVADRSATAFVPVMCQHCADAPCEAACPTMATYRSPDGLNATVYSACEGLRYCEKRCPYQVRVFNHGDPQVEGQQILGVNPRVAVRWAGVTEKCTLCAHRIRAARTNAVLQGRPFEVDEAIPACAQTCPSKAIHFGDWAAPDATLTGASTSSRGYSLPDPSPRPRATFPGVVYLAKITGEGP